MLLQYDVGIVGLSRLDAGLRNAEQRFSLHNARVFASQRAPRTGVAAEGARMASRAQALADIRLEAKLKEIEAKKQAALEVAAAKTAAGARIKSEQTAARTINTERKSLHMQELSRIRQEERARKQAAKEVAKTERAEARASAAAKKQAEREVSLAQRLQIRDAARSAREHARVVRGRERFIGSVGRSFGGAVRSVGMMGGLALGAGATALAVAGIADEARAERQAAVLANNAIGQEGETRTGDQIASSVRQVAQRGVAQGVSKEDTLQGISNFSALSGRLAVGERLAPLMSGVAQAYGADIGDVGATAGNVAKAYLAKDPTMSAEALEGEISKVLLTLVNQAKAGSVEFKDFAAQMAKVASVAGQSDVPLGDMIANVGALVQLSKGSSPEAMATSAASLARSITKKSSELESGAAAGAGPDGRLRKVKVFTDGTKQNKLNIVDIAMDIVSATRGNQAKIADIVSGEGMPALEPFIQAYAEGAKGKKGKEADESGKAAMKKLLGTMMAGPVTEKQFAEDRSRVQNTSAAKLETELGKLKDVVGTSLLPEVTKLIPKFSGLVAAITPLLPEIARLLGYLAENPLKGLGAAMALKVTADIGSAAIGDVIRSGLSNILAAIRFPGGVPPLTPPLPLAGAPGVLAPTLAADAAGTTAAVAGGSAIAAIGAGLAAGATVGAITYGLNAQNEADWEKQRVADQKLRAQDPEAYKAQQAERYRQHGPGLHPVFKQAEGPEFYPGKFFDMSMPGSMPPASDGNAHAPYADQARGRQAEDEATSRAVDAQLLALTAQLDAASAEAEKTDALNRSTEATNRLSEVMAKVSIADAGLNRDGGSTPVKVR